MGLIKITLVMAAVSGLAGCSAGIKNSSENPATDAAQQSGISTFSSSRYVGFLDSWSISTPEETKSDPSVIGALEYGSSETAQDRVLVRTSTTNPFSIEDLAVATAKEPSKFSESLDLWSADGKEDPAPITGFIIRAKLIEVGGGDRQLTVWISITRRQQQESNCSAPNLARSSLPLSLEQFL
jgi:hypothetical protein